MAVGTLHDPSGRKWTVEYVYAAGDETGHLTPIEEDADAALPVSRIGAFVDGVPRYLDLELEAGEGWWRCYLEAPTDGRYPAVNYRGFTPARQALEW